MRLPPLHTPLKATWDVAGNNTETLWWPARNQDAPKTVMLFIPGNPGLVEYYRDFLEEIHQNASPSLEIFAVSNLGMSITPASNIRDGDTNGLFSLQEQIDHKVECFDILRRENNTPETEFILMGHSIGAYISVEVLKRRHTERITRVITLFPTLREIGLTPNGISITKLLSYVPISLISTSASLLSCISVPILTRLVMLLTGQRGPCAHVTALRLLHGSVVKNCLHMAKHEMETVRELDDDFYNAHADKFIIYYSRNDKWAPPDHYDYMKKVFPEHEHLYLCEQDIPHSFILNAKDGSYMAQKVVSWLADNSC
ncbi:hypothetical protein BJV82DRAFT_562960 [Fennellomyces sp. T-0311]|nr:hypothetical protein BJV82DRAFT_562960 [Fennellomyces sp. T-0311]